MKISIESTQLTQKTSKANKTYFQQQGYAHLVNTDGSPQRYPREIVIFPSRDSEGNAVPYQKGDYMLTDSSFKVDERGYLTIGFANLQKADK